MVPGQPLPGRTGAHWDTLGFQGKDPVTDFRGMGVCGVATYSSCAACRVLTTGFTNSLCSSTFCRSSLSGFLFSPSLICNKKRRVKVPPTYLLSPCPSFLLFVAFSIYRNAFAEHADIFCDDVAGAGTLHTGGVASSAAWVCGKQCVQNAGCIFFLCIVGIRMLPADWLKFSSNAHVLRCRYSYAITMINMTAMADGWLKVWLVL